MRIIDLIKQLQDLRASYDAEYITTMGEPEIMIDVFNNTSEPYKYVYGGFSPYFIIENSADGCYKIVSAFVESHPSKEEHEKNINPTA